MGLLDIFRKKRTVLDSVSELLDQGSKNTNTPLMCYGMAYLVLPKAIFGDTQVTLERIHAKPESAGFSFFTRACMASGCTPRRDDAGSFPVHLGQLRDHKSYIIFGYPEPPPVSLDAGVPVLAPYFSGVVIDQSTGEIAYYVLGQAIRGGTTFRAVTAEGLNANLGKGSAPTVNAFVELLREGA